MSLYSVIDRRINASRGFRQLSHDAQLVWFRLLTGPHVTSVPGLWGADEDGLAKAFGFSAQAFLELIDELNGAGLSVEADWEYGVIWIPGLMKQECSQPRNSNAVNSWVHHLELIPECDLRDRAVKALKEWVLERSRGWANSPLQFLKLAESLSGNLSASFESGSSSVRGNLSEDPVRFSKTQEQEQDQKQDQDQDQDLKRAGSAVAPKERSKKSDSPRPKAPAKKRKQQIPNNWQPSERCVELLCTDLGFTPEQLIDQIPEFIDFWHSEAEAKADWDATFRNRIRSWTKSGRLRPKRKLIDPVIAAKATKDRDAAQAAMLASVNRELGLTGNEPAPEPQAILAQLASATAGGTA